ncbi:MAG: RNA polymerase sigma factor [Flavobacteriales bacterium]|nr:RNA polymerase sigma factor [Flavobacteriales bacterium]MBP9177477.1 RNA polymerase sigma factor [Flavobacteriales bacterium]
MALFGTEYGKQSDERLMELVVRGDEKAFAALYDRYSRRLLNYFYRMLWSDREKAQDFLQDLFAKLATRPQSYDAARPFQTWLFSVANNMCKNAYRHEAVVREAAIHLRNGVDRVEATGGIELDRERFRDRLDEELDKLDPDHKATFVMRFNEDMAIKEIAAVFNCSEGTVKSRIFYTLKKLAERMKEFDPKLIDHGSA